MIIEAQIHQYLTGALDVPAYVDRPEGSSAPFILIQKTGSTTRNGLTTAMVAIQSYGASLYNAAQLNEELKSAMLAMPDTCDVSAVHLNSDYNFTSANNNEYRYQAVFDISYIGG